MEEKLNRSEVNMIKNESTNANDSNLERMVEGQVINNDIVSLMK